MTYRLSLFPATREVRWPPRPRMRSQTASSMKTQKKVLTILETQSLTQVQDMPQSKPLANRSVRCRDITGPTGHHSAAFVQRPH